MSVTETEFARQFQKLYHSVFLHCFRRLNSESERLSAQKVAILGHMANVGPLTVHELSQHLDRARSTITEMIDRLENNGLVERIRDERDKRRTLIWLSEDGLEKLNEAQSPLDSDRVVAMANRLTPDERQIFLTLFDKITTG
ncbi:MAG: MarR family transcriptional regulator [Cohaesibacteraceae bacterium]|nr:MarR family transcriptional regulator [Cohaesibacteraceae bacterium]MBL4877007.1 MarR family transcriptional regulator [Cohaesibacteraceae bacterium]